VTAERIRLCETHGANLSITALAAELKPPKSVRRDVLKLEAAGVLRTHDQLILAWPLCASLNPPQRFELIAASEGDGWPPGGCFFLQFLGPLHGADAGYSAQAEDHRFRWRTSSASTTNSTMAHRSRPGGFQRRGCCVVVGDDGGHLLQHAGAVVAEDVILTDSAGLPRNRRPRGTTRRRCGGRSRRAFCTLDNCAHVRPRPCRG